MSQQVQAPKKSKRKLAGKIIRGALTGGVIGFAAGNGFYLMALATNLLAGTTVINPVYFILMWLGLGSVGGVAYELSKEYEE